MHGPMNVKSPNNTSKGQMGFNSAFKGLKPLRRLARATTFYAKDGDSVFLQNTQIQLRGYNGS
jgi:hypothetical protein